MLGYLLVVAPAAAPLAPAAPQEAWRELAVPALCEPGPPELVGSQRPPGSHLELDLPVAASSRTPSSFHLPLVSLLELLETDSKRADLGLRCIRTAPPLVARGSEEALARAADLVRDLDVAGEALDFRLDVTLAPAGADPLEFTRVVRSGELVLLGEREAERFLADFEVDVATGSGTADPIPGRALTGKVVELRAWRSPRGDAAFVRGTLDLAELVSIEPLDLGSSELGVIEVPRVRSVEVVFSGRVESGKPLTVEVKGAPLAVADWTLTIEPTLAKPATTSPWRVLDLAWFESPMPTLDLPTPGAGALIETTRGGGTRGPEPLSTAIIWGELEAALGNRRGDRPVAAFAPGIVVAPAAETRLWETLENLTSAAERARWSTHRVLVAADGVQVTFPAASGLDCRVLVGYESTTLVDFDTEIAPEFWLAEPRVERVFDGFLAQARVAGRDLVGNYWIASGADKRQLSLDETLHGSAPMIGREVEAGAIRARSGAGATLGKLWVGFDPW